jgi:NADH:ubiquinone oxidoreductase subunit 6 (subunit J)
MNLPVLVHTVVLVILGAILVFGLIGISVARESATSLPHIWVPGTLAIASGLLIAIALYRFIRRWFR